MQRIFDILFNFHKLYSKRWAVVFFDFKNMPVVGDTITVGELRATFEKIEEEKEIMEANGDKFYIESIDLEETSKLMQPIHDFVDEKIKQLAEEKELLFWECRKCHLTQDKILSDSEGILQCNQCGFRTTDNEPR